MLFSQQHLSHVSPAIWFTPGVYSTFLPGSTNSCQLCLSASRCVGPLMAVAVPLQLNGKALVEQRTRWLLRFQRYAMSIRWNEWQGWATICGLTLDFRIEMYPVKPVCGHCSSVNMILTVMRIVYKNFASVGSVGKFDNLMEKQFITRFTWHVYLGHYSDHFHVVK